MPGTGPKAKHWCFTKNNYTPADVDRLSSQIEGVQYIVFGKEVGASGTPHLQGTISFEARKRRTQVTAIIGQAHLTVTRHLHQSIEYCKKDGDFVEIGMPPSGQGERSDLEDFKASVREGVTSLIELRELHSNVCASYPRFVKDYIHDQRPVVQVITTQLKGLFFFFSKLTPLLS